MSFLSKSVDEVLAVFHEVVAKLEEVIDREETALKAKEEKIFRLTGETALHNVEIQKASKAISKIKALLS